MDATPLPSGFKKKYGDMTFEGLPYNGKVINRKEDDPDYRQPVLCSTVKTRIFDLSKEGEIEAWNEIMQKVADGVVTVSFEEKTYDQSIHSWRVLLRWMEMYYTNPEGYDDVDVEKE